MSWNPKQEEINSVVRLPCSKRYEYSVKHVVDEERIWSLYHDGWALAANNHGDELVPVWPHPCYAALCAIGEWEGFEPREITLSAWLERWVPGMRKDGRRVAVFPTTLEEGVGVDPDRLLFDLQKEIESYE